MSLLALAIPLQCPTDWECEKSREADLAMPSG